MYAVPTQLIQLGELLADNIRRVALIGLVVVEQDLMVLANQHQLGCGRAAVDARDRRRLRTSVTFSRHDVVYCRGGV